MYLSFHVLHYCTGTLILITCHHNIAITSLSCDHHAVNFLLFTTASFSFLFCTKHPLKSTDIRFRILLSSFLLFFFFLEGLCSHWSYITSVILYSQFARGHICLVSPHFPAISSAPLILLLAHPHLTQSTIPSRVSVRRFKLQMDHWPNPSSSQEGEYSYVSTDG